MDRRIRQRVILWGGVSVFGAIGLIAWGVFFLKSVSSEYRWYSENPAYIVKSVFVHKGRLLYWSALVDYTGGSCDLSLVPIERLQERRQALAWAQENLVTAENESARMAPTAPLSDREALQKKLDSTRALVLICDSGLVTSRELALLTVAKTADSGGAAGFFLSRRGQTIRETIVQFPLWVMALPFLGLFLCGFRARTIYRRAKAGLCPYCGYDLRGSPGERCPECGAGISRKSARPGTILRAARGIARNRLIAGLTAISLGLATVIVVSFWRSLHWDRWPVSDLIAAPAPPWTHIMIADGLLTIVQTASGNPPAFAPDSVPYVTVKAGYELQLRRDVPSGFLFEKKMVVPPDIQASLRTARCNVVEILMRGPNNARAQWSYVYWSTHLPERQLVISMPLWPVFLMIASCPAIMIRRNARLLGGTGKHIESQ